MPISMVKTLNAHLKPQNPKYPRQRSQPKLPTLKVKTLTADLHIHYFINKLQNIHFTYCQN